MKRMSLTIQLFAVFIAGCKPEETPPASGGASEPSAGAAKVSTPPAAAVGQPGHGGAVVELGTTDANGMSVKASRDKGEIQPGAEAPIDVWIDGGLGDAAAVRFWIGTQDAKGSVKARAEVEAGKWHTHVEVPDPLPAESRLWVEIEGKDGTRKEASYDLRM